MSEGYFSNEELKDIRIADPFILKTSGGDYYLYGTTSDDGFACRHSADLINWGDWICCYERKPGTWCENSSSFWAPEVIWYRDRYYMFYTARNAQNSLRIGIAAADTPVGPFEDYLKDRPLFDCGQAAIDPNVLVDDDGTMYLYFARDHPENNGKSEIFGAVLKDDLTGIEGEPVLLLSPSQDWEKASVNPLWNEAPEVIRHDGRYYLSYSANYYADSSYSVGYAVSDAPLGTYVKAAKNPILTSIGMYGKSRDDVSGTGHHCFVVSPDETELWVAYHSHVDIKNPGNERRLNLDKAGFTADGRLWINGPTTALQPVPSGAGKTGK